MSRFRSHVWWMFASLVVATVLGLALGSAIGWLGYALFNIAGVWLYCESDRSRRSKSLMKGLAILMVPVGVLGVFANGNSGLRPTELVSVGSEERANRTEAARALGMFNRGSS